MTVSSRQAVQSLQNRQFWTEFFLLYESLPALWNIRCPLYKERSARLEAYDQMVDKLRELEPNADRDDVLRKINIFRTNYRRECSRINMSNLLGKKYKTTLWYFDLLSFLQSSERGVRKASDIDEIEKSILRKKPLSSLSPNIKVSYTMSFPKKAHNLEVPQMMEEESYSNEDDVDNRYEYIPSEGIHHTSDGSCSQFMPNQQRFQSEFQTFSLSRLLGPKQDMTNPEGLVADCEEDEERAEDEEAFVQLMEHRSDTSEEGLNNISKQNTQRGSKNALHIEYITPGSGSSSTSPKKYLKHVKTMTDPIPNGKSSEEADILAKSWAIQYDEMSAEQKIYARKAIADILFDGCMGNLGNNSGTVRVTTTSCTQLPPSSTKVTRQKKSTDAVEMEESGYVYEGDVCEDGIIAHDWMVKMK